MLHLEIAKNIKSTTTRDKENSKILTTEKQEL